MSTVFWDPHFSRRDCLEQVSPYHSFMFPQIQILLVQILCYLSFQEWSLQVMMSSEETTKPKPFTTPEGDAALFLIKCKCKITLCYLPSLGLWSNLGLWSVMHNIPINNLLGSSNLSRLRTIPALMELV